MIKVIYLLTFLLLYSCLPKTDCSELEKMNRQQVCIAIVTELPIYADNFLSNGVNPYTQKNCDCVEKSRWWRNYIDEISIGDTIIKNKGQLSFNIHKRDTIIKHYWKCEGKIYK